MSSSSSSGSSSSSSSSSTSASASVSGHRPVSAYAHPLLQVATNAAEYNTLTVNPSVSSHHHVVHRRSTSPQRSGDTVSRTRAADSQSGGVGFSFNPMPVPSPRSRLHQEGEQRPSSALASLYAMARVYGAIPSVSVTLQ